MATMRMGQAIGLTDQLLRDIHVGDLLTDANGVEYTVDRYGRALPVQGSNEVPIRKLKGCEVKLAWTPAPERPEKNDEEKEIDSIVNFVHDAGDQTLVDELRARGWTVTCTRMVQKITYEEVAL